VTLRVLVPETGYASLDLRDDPHRWLRASMGLTECATTPARSMLGDATELHFRCLDDAVTFHQRFPMLVLADVTLSPTYHSPHLPSGREEATVCNLYNLTTTQEAMRQVFPTRSIVDFHPELSRVFHREVSHL
jgi:hypothetical protein